MYRTLQKSCLAALTIVATAGAVLAMQPPYLPPAHPITPYQPTTVPVSTLQIKLNSEETLKLTQFVSERSLNGTWKCSGLTNSDRPFADDSDLKLNYAAANFDDNQWDKIAVPLDWYKQYAKFRQTDKEKKTCSKPFIKGWYRHNIQLTPEDLAGKNIILHFDVAAYDARLFVNGQEAGRHHGDFTPWDVNITKYVKAGNNTIALRLFSDFGPFFSAIGRTEWNAAGTLSGTGVMKATHAYGSQWSISNIKGGLWQNVSLRLEPQIFFQYLLVNPILKDSAIEVEYTIDNPTGKAIEVQVGGAVVSAMKQAGAHKIGDVLEKHKITLTPGLNQGKISIGLKQPEYWSPENPYLYYAALYLKANGKIITADAARFGFREFKTVGCDFYLNGKKIYLFGENLPAVMFGGYGRTETEETAKLAEAIQGFKSLGYNIIRNPHMPIIPLALNIADEVGLMFLNEWAWCFTRELDEPAFEKNNREEISEWIYRDYNHPCTVIWGCGNEVVHKDNPIVKRQLDNQVDWVHALEKSGRPVSSFSATGTWGHYGKAKLKTDLIDYHTYLGLSAPAWTCWDDSFSRDYQGTVETYAENGKFNMPYIIWEAVGFSWGTHHDPNFKVNNIRQYAEYVEKDTSWGQPNGIGFAGMLGVGFAVDPKRGEKLGRIIYGRRILEQYRQDQNIQGFAPWFHGYDLSIATLWNQPVFCGLRNPGSIMIRNAFTGSTVEQQFYLVNSSNQNYQKLNVELTMVRPDGQTVAITQLAVDELKAWAKITKAIKFNLPADCPVGWGQIRLLIKADGKEISRNYYDLFLQTPAMLTQPVTAKVKTALFDTGSSQDVANTAAILKSLKIEFTTIKTEEEASQYGLVIIPPTGNEAKIKTVHMDRLLSWVRQGGSLLILEQNPGGITAVNAITLLNAPNTFVDLVIPAHPVFNGLSQENFDTWNNPDHGFTVTTVMNPFTINALAARGGFLGQRGVSNAVAEGTFGNGRVFSSQLNAVELWGKDASASTYLRNLLTYMTAGGKPFHLVQPLESSKRKDFSMNPQDAVLINLRPYVNRSFTDEVAGDGKGGWTDQGTNDFRTMPLGKQVLAGIPFEIIDPAKNHDHSCIVLRGRERPYFPPEVKGIVINQRLARLFFLHTCAWSFGKEVARYQINYTDGTQAEMLLIEGRNIVDWWNCVNLADAKLAVTKINALKQTIGAVAAAWENPHPEKMIASFDFIATGDAVPILIAVTGEKSQVDPLIISSTNEPKTLNWGGIAWEGGNKPTFKTVKSPDSPYSKEALKIAMPAHNNTGTPVAIRRFDKTKLTKQNYQFLTFWIKAEGSAGVIDVVLPIADWKAKLTATIPLADKNDKWTKIRLSLNDDMGLNKIKGYTLRDLRGELLIYNGMSGTRPAADFQIDGVMLE